ncbi:MAG: hypothetical protein OEY79_05220, partial [Anaplasmataceae bacterium]|nr:hypothetical protein [Anaplasmataceae bacterium]
EETFLGHTSTASDNINNTFLNRVHKSFDVGVVPIGASTCKALVTWVNDTVQSQTESALFQEVLLMDANSQLVYTALIDQDTSSYKDDVASANVTYDFQALVPDINGVGVTTYYFYVEITG